MKVKSLVFLTLLLCLVSCQTEVQTRVYGRYVPERKDDFAWENEYAAFRLYGAALKPENPSNGVDLWLKNSPALVIDTMYGRELKDHRPYHINYDGNLDCYKVGHTCGAGGLVVIANDSTYIGGPYDRWDILEQTPDKFVFRLYYDSFLVAGHIMQEVLTITAEAGTPWNRADVVLTADSFQLSIPSDRSPKEIRTFNFQLLVGGGIYLHEMMDQLEYIGQDGLQYTEDALSDKQAAQMNYDYNGSISQGRVTIMVRTPGAVRVGVKDGNAIAVRPYIPGDTLTYFFGATWSEWKQQ